MPKLIIEITAKDQGKLIFASMCAAIEASMEKQKKQFEQFVDIIIRKEA